MPPVVAAARIAAAALLAGVLSCVPVPAVAGSAPKATLKAFASEQEIADLLRGWADAQRRRADVRRATSSGSEGAVAGLAAQAPAAAPLTDAAAKAEAATGADAITNVQHAGVDEGGIVKRRGDHLIVLRRGRLFTIDIRDRRLEPVAAVDAYGEGIDPRGAWYDEMLIHGDTVVVIGFSYARGGTEIGLFDLSRDGALRHRATHHLRSNDYYSSRNYASRLIGSKLVFYTPLHLNAYAADPFVSFPAMRRWTAGATAHDFRRIAPATRIYRTDDAIDPDGALALHTVTVCDLARAELDCESTAVLGPPGRVFYVSGGSVYVWTTAWRRGAAQDAPSAVFRIPLDGGAPSALKAAGSPIDQFSFLEGDDAHLNVLVRAGGRGDGMWAAEARAGDLALLRVPLASFSDGRERAPASAYRTLPGVDGGALQNRYVGGHLLYGAGTGWGRPQRTLHSTVHALRYASSAAVQSLPLAHAVDRIEALGGHAVVVGSDGRDLHFTSVRLDGAAAAVDRYTRKDAAQAETRSHGFFYRRDGESDGLVGLPIVGPQRPGSQQLARPAASVLFLGNRSLRLAELGALDSAPATGTPADDCRASCVDWYGNSRPIFTGGRIFALMGYELVEGRLADGRVAEVRRVDVMPRARIAR